MASVRTGMQRTAAGRRHIRGWSSLSEASAPLRTPRFLAVMCHSEPLAAVVVPGLRVSVGLSEGCVCLWVLVNIPVGNTWFRVAS